MENAGPGNNEEILSVADLKVGFESGPEVLEAVRGVSFAVKRGEIVGIVGESGCGKSVTALSILRLLPHPAAKILGGAIHFAGQNLLVQPIEAMAKIRGKRISMIFQEPMTALNPVMRIGDQIAEALFVHNEAQEVAAAEARCVDLLGRVGIADAESRLRQYPHQLSGGMRQRVMIAMALACDPDLLIADEPTTALDVTVQAQILELIVSLQKESGMGVVFITHDLGVVAEICHRVVVMYRGRVIEEGTVEQIFSQPSHPYTRGLMQAIPSAGVKPKSKLSTIEGSVPPLIEHIPGCAFANRCPHADQICTKKPAVQEIKTGHKVSCHHWEKLL